MNEMLFIFSIILMLRIGHQYKLKSNQGWYLLLVPEMYSKVELSPSYLKIYSNVWRFSSRQLQFIVGMINAISTYTGVFLYNFLIFSTVFVCMPVSVAFSYQHIRCENQNYHSNQNDILNNRKTHSDTLLLFRFDVISKFVYLRLHEKCLLIMLRSCFSLSCIFKYRLLPISWR